MLNHTLSELVKPSLKSITLDINEQLSQDLIDRINLACDEIEDVDKDSVLLVQLNAVDNKVFNNSCTNDLSTHLVGHWEKVLRRIEKLEAITVFVSESDVNALGLALLLTTDYRITKKDHSIQVIDSYGKLLPGMILHRLVQHVGLAKARHLILFPKSISAMEAKQLSIFDEISDNIEESVLKLVSSIKKEFFNDVIIRRRLLLEASFLNYDEALGMHLAACDRILR